MFEAQMSRDRQSWDWKTRRENCQTNRAKDPLGSEPEFLAVFEHGLGGIVAPARR